MKILVPCFLIIAFMSACTTPGPVAERHQKVHHAVKHDPVEDDPRYKDIFGVIDAEVRAALKDDSRQGSLGFVHIFWEKKKEILKQRHDIDWKSPAEMNPHILFD